MSIFNMIAGVFSGGFRGKMGGIAQELDLTINWATHATAYFRVTNGSGNYLVVVINVGEIVHISVPSGVKFRPGRVPIWLTSEMLKGNSSREWGEWDVTDSDDESHLSLKLRLSFSRLTAGLFATAMSEMIDEVSGLDRKLNTM